MMDRASSVLVILCWILLAIDSGLAQSQNCGRYSRQCANGDCIRSSDVCDGVVNCADGSDETAVVCIASECPSYSFRCAYGACVGRAAECNGVQDCADNSDELTQKCPEKQPGQLSGSCSSNMFQCDSGQCIPIYLMCDGRLDCADSSDETVKYCAASPCRKFAFRCGYGACIPGGRRCDGKIDCVDGSDESQLLCNYTEPLTTTTQRPQYTQRPQPDPLPNNINVPQSTSRPVYQATSQPVYQTPSPPFQRPNPPYQPNQPNPGPSTDSIADDPSSCRVDNIPTDGDAYFMDKIIKYGTYVPNYATIEYRCIENHAIDGSSSNRCSNGNWAHPKATCRPKCDPKAIDGITILANCYQRINNREENVDCRQPIEPGTYATINCKAGYENTDDFHKRVTCGVDGRWSPEPVGCTQTCGHQGSLGKPFIVGGFESNIADVPWHAGLYMKQKTTGDFEHICGGSIISARLVVSAMHCFWDASDNRVHNRRQFQVAVGKSRRGLAEREQYPVQQMAIENLLYDDAYNHEQSYYVNDIVVVVLETYIEFKTYVAPVCIQWTLTFEEAKVQPGIIGKVAGWGLTSPGGETSPVLKAIEMPTVSRDECIANSPDTFKNFITFDKFCAGYLDGVSVCQGDSGGGIVFPETNEKNTLYYLRGIVSVGVRLDNSCDNFRYATFTNVNKYIDLLKQNFLEYQPKL